MNSELAISDTLRHLKAGSLDRLRDPNANPPGIILGSRLAEDIGMRVGDNIELLHRRDDCPCGIRPVKRRFKVCGIFETGFYEIDDNWAYLAIGAAQKALSVDQINQIELNVDDLNRAPDDRQGHREGGGRALHHHHLDGAQQATAGRARRWSGW